MNRRYPGWTNLFIAAMAMVATLPSRTFGLGLITEQVIQDFGLTRVSYATINLWSTVIGALFCLPVGCLLDRFGARRVLAATAVCLAISTWSMTHVRASFLGLFVTFTLLRGFGQSALSVVSLALVSKWFTRRLPLAMGIYSILISIGFVIAFMLTGQEVIASGWRAAWTNLGLFALLVLTPLAVLFARSQPSTGDLTVELDIGRTSASPGVSWTLAEALRTNAFWSLSIASALYAFVSSALLLFQESILKARGFEAQIFQQVQAVSLVSGLIANFGAGWLAERKPLPRLMAFAMAVQGALLVSVPFLKTIPEAYAYGAGMGAAGGIATVIFFAAWGKLFGRENVGHIQGAAQLLTVLASAIGPLMLASSYERFGTYERALLSLALPSLGLAFWCWLTKAPRLSEETFTEAAQVQLTNRVVEGP